MSNSAAACIGGGELGRAQALQAKVAGLSSDLVHHCWLNCLKQRAIYALNYEHQNEQALDQLAIGMSSALDIDGLFNDADYTG